ncbi:MAG: hypothetical protein M3N98_02980 [Actinomycetota bacterium]|nr:hypothetical protein [Actinomycetota bacterium]
MLDPRAPYRFYGDLAIWWPLISPVEEYLEEAAYASILLRSHPSEGDAFEPRLDPASQLPSTPPPHCLCPRSRTARRPTTPDTASSAPDGRT